MELGLKAARETPRARTFPMLFDAPLHDIREHDAPRRKIGADEPAAKAESKRKQARAARKKNRKGKKKK